MCLLSYFQTLAHSFDFILKWFNCWTYGKSLFVGHLSLPFPPIDGIKSNPGNLEFQIHSPLAVFLRSLQNWQATICAHNIIIQGVPKKRNNRTFWLWTLFWPFFDLLMTLTPYKHLIKYFLCPNHNFLSIRIFKRLFCRVLGHQKVKNGQKRVLSQQILLLLYFGTPCTFSLRRVLPTAIADVSH